MSLTSSLPPLETSPTFWRIFPIPFPIHSSSLFHSLRSSHYPCFSHSLCFSAICRHLPKMSLSLLFSLSLIVIFSLPWLSLTILPRAPRCPSQFVPCCSPKFQQPTLWNSAHQALVSPFWHFFISLYTFSHHGTPCVATSILSRSAFCVCFF